MKSWEIGKPRNSFQSKLTPTSKNRSSLIQKITESWHLREI